MAYKVDPKNIMEVMAYLDHREKGGYTTKEVTFYPHPVLDTKPYATLLYIGTEANPLYLGPAPLKDIAMQVFSARGHSGCNTEYVLNLAHSMRKIAPGVEDQHLFSLECHIREMLGRRKEQGIKLMESELGTKGEENKYKCTCKDL